MCQENVVFDYRVTGHFGQFYTAHNTVLYAERVILLTSEYPRGGTLIGHDFGTILYEIWNTK